MTRFAQHIVLRNISLLLCGGLILTVNGSLPLKPPCVDKKIKITKTPAVKPSAKTNTATFSLYNDVVVPLFPALKI